MIAVKTPDDFLHIIMSTLGYAPAHVVPDKFLRLRPRKSGWAKLFSDGLGGVFGCYKQNLSSHWSARVNQTPSELAAMRHQMHQAAREREAAQLVQWAKNALKNAALWAESELAGEAVILYLAARGLADWCISGQPSSGSGKPLKTSVCSGQYPAQLRAEKP